MPPTRDSLEQWHQDDFLNYTVTMIIWWLPGRKGLGDGKYFLEGIKGEYLNHGYLSWGFVLEMPEVEIFSFPEHFLLVGTPA